jgi:hypothetical protein
MHSEMLRYLIRRSSEDTEFRQMLEKWARGEKRKSFFFGAPQH